MDGLFKEEEIFDALFPPSDQSEDCDDTDYDPDFVMPSSSEDEFEKTVHSRKNKLPVFFKLDPWVNIPPSSEDDDEDQISVHRTRDKQTLPSTDQIEDNRPSTSGVQKSDKSTSSTASNQINPGQQKYSGQSYDRYSNSCNSKNKSKQNISLKGKTPRKPYKKTTSNVTKARQPNKIKTGNKRNMIPWEHGSILPKVYPFDHSKEILPEEILNLDSPYSFFKFFFKDELLHKIVSETNLYAIQQNPNTNFSITSSELIKYIGICIFMSIIRLPNVRCYWKETIGNSIISETMGVNRFEQIRRFIHFNDNMSMIPKGEPGHDRLHKLRPVIETLRDNFRSIPHEEMLCVDEQLCATKARHYLKQYLPNKPHKWGYKLYVLSGVSGFAYSFEIYTGQENSDDNRLLGEPDLGSCANVVVRLSRSIPKQIHHKIYFDNFYTTVELMAYLEQNQIHAVGTARMDRLRNDKLPSKLDLNNKPRGFCAETCAQINGVDVSSVIWKDNKCVVLLSTYVGTHPKTEVKRYNKKKKVSELVPCPNVVTIYNKHMGGVDKINSIIGRYKIKMRTKKWYLRLFYHLIDVTICNSWLLYLRAQQSKNITDVMPLAEFREEVAITMCKLGEKTTPQRGRPRNDIELEINAKRRKPNVSYLPPKEVRQDNTGHWPIWTETRQRCKLPKCNGKSFVICDKCKINLCFNKDKNCFKKFHSL